MTWLTPVNLSQTGSTANGRESPPMIQATALSNPIKPNQTKSNL
jgi:hypothetical protein